MFEFPLKIMILVNFEAKWFKCRFLKKTWGLILKWIIDQSLLQICQKSVMNGATELYCCWCDISVSQSILNVLPWWLNWVIIEPFVSLLYQTHYIIIYCHFSLQNEMWETRIRSINEPILHSRQKVSPLFLLTSVTKYLKLAFIHWGSVQVKPLLHSGAERSQGVQKIYTVTRKNMNLAVY